MLDSALEINSFLNRFLQALRSPFVDIIIILIEVCWELGYYPRKFKAARTVALHKPNKRDYKLFNTWRFIALLNIIGKLIEATTAKRLRDAAETYILFPDF